MTTTASVGNEEDISKQLSKCGASVASCHDVVYNSECVYTFHSPFSSSKGILVNLVTFIGTCEDYAKHNTLVERSNTLFLRIVKTRHEKKKKTDEQPITKLGIGIDGGFQSLEEEEIRSNYSIVLWNNHKHTIDLEIPYYFGNNNNDTKDHHQQQQQQLVVVPDFIQKSVESILHHVGTQVQQDVQLLWELDEQNGSKPISKFCTNLPFVDNGIMISPNPQDWRCQASFDKENLWLNLSDGYIGGGRKNWDGSGGSNGALEHYIYTGSRYPLVVKLGTITSDPTTADCYSYDSQEDGPVQIPNLAELLAKRGILVSSLQKTVRSTAELEVELNATYAFDAITEAGSALIPVSGPGLQGLLNLGNSCYINTVCQTLFSGTIPELVSKYSNIIHNNNNSMIVVPPKGAASDVLSQTIKLTNALSSGEFSSITTITTAAATSEDATTTPQQQQQQYRLAPQMFIHAVCQNHVEFRTGQQQDAAHFLQFLLETLDRAELKAGTTKDNVTSRLFAHKIASRIVCSADNKTKYKTDTIPSTILAVRIPKELLVSSTTDTTTQQNYHTTNDTKGDDDDDDDHNDDTIATKGDDEEKQPESKRQKSIEPMVPTISFQTCMDAWHAPFVIEDYNWPHLNNTAAAAISQSGLENFPKYLFVQLQRYELGPNWIPIKIEVNVDVPEHVDFSFLKISCVPLPGEVLVPEEANTTASSLSSFDDAVVVPMHDVSSSSSTRRGQEQMVDEFSLSQLMDMGFSLHGCTRALSAVGGSNVEAATNWIFDHNMDPDFNDPLLPTTTTTPTISEVVEGNNRHCSNLASTFTVDETVVSSLVESLGCFTFDQVRASLIAAGGAMDRAADWLFSHMDDLDSAIAELGTNTNAALYDEQQHPLFTNACNDTTAAVAAGDSRLLDDGEGKYTLVGCISHIGKNVGSGHYVCHLKRDGKWVIFNDEKIALSEHPPLQHAYMYLFRRDDAFESAPPASGEYINSMMTSQDSDDEMNYVL